MDWLNYWCKKIVIFMHDPFEKTHLLLTKKAHEEKAKEHLGDVLKYLDCLNRLEKLLKEVKEYDVLASTLDRWIMKKENYEPKRIVNPFDPDFVYDVGSEEYFKLDKAKLSEFYETIDDIIDELKGKLEKVELAQAIYHILYGIAEPLWYEKVGKVQLADTRSPNHTIFDHLSASVGISNVYEQNKFKGYLVELDVPGIQSFISGGRGPGDWWVRSWLTSAFVWYMIKELVWALGADVMLSPTARYNPFYYSLLREKLWGKSSKLNNILEKLPYPDQPVMPGTVTLLLPDLDILRNIEHLGDKLTNCKDSDEACVERALTEYFRERMLDAWKRLVEKAEEVLDEFFNQFFNQKDGNAEDEKLCLRVDGGMIVIDEGCENSEEKAIGKIKELLDKLKQRPPLVPKVTAVSVGKAHDEFKNKFDEFKKNYENEMKGKFKELYNSNWRPPYCYCGDVNGCYNCFMQGLERKLFFHWLLTNKFIRESKKRKSVSISNRVIERWTCERTSEIYRSGSASGAKLCSCGRPAIIHNNTDEFVPPIRARETLCPYCLVMRLAQYKTSAYEVFVGSHDSSKIVAPRLHIMTLAGLPELAKYIEEKGLVQPKLVYEELVKTLRENVVPKTAQQTGGAVMRSLDLERLIDKLEERGTITVLISSSSPENAYSIMFKKDDIAFLKNKMNKYYTMIKADADGMGDLKSGKLGMSTMEYFKKLVEASLPETPSGEGQGSERNLVDKLSELLETIIRSFYDYFYPKETVVETDEIGETDDKASNDSAAPPTTLVTPSYAYQLSYALMIEALRDKDIILDNYGIVIYSGGDDLLALVPARALHNSECMEPLRVRHVSTEVANKVRDEYCSPALWAWWLTRLNHWALTEVPLGFFKDNSYFAPAPVAFGKKYGIAIRHYRDPLSAVFEDADALESKAKIFTKIFKKNAKSIKKLEKDGVAVSYGRAGFPEGAALPNTLLSNDKKKLELGLIMATLVKEIADKEGSLSKNFVYDLEKQTEDLCGRLKEMTLSKSGAGIELKKTMDVIEALWLSVVSRNLQKNDDKVIKVVKEIFEKLYNENTTIEVSREGSEVKLGEDVSRVLLACELVSFLREWARAAR